MQWYAETPVRRTRQIIGDLLVLLWVVLWVLVARWTYSLIRMLAAPADPLRSAGGTVQDRLTEVADRVGEVPLVGDQLTSPFTGAADAGTSLVEAANALDRSVTRLAWVLALLVAATPILLVLAAYLAERVTAARRAAAMGRLRAGESALELLALRALVTQTPGRLVRVHADPLSAWRSGDQEAITALAGLELKRLGLRAALRQA